MADYGKPHLAFDEQRELLQTRGLAITDPSEFDHALETIGYYRLSGYWYPFRDLDRSTGLRLDRFSPGTSSGLILELYEFDRRLKLLVLDAIERVEIAVRVAVGHTAGRRHPYVHLEPAQLDRRFTQSQGGRDALYDGWRRRYDNGQARSREAFVAHFASNYDARLPIWAATEIMEFGSLSWLLWGLPYQDRSEIASLFRVPNESTFTSWLRTLVYVRNVCAHHSRFWNRNLDVQPKLPRTGAIPTLDHLRDKGQRAISRAYSALALLAYLLDPIDTRAVWKAAMRSHLVQLPSHVDVNVDDLGFPAGWASLPLWSVSEPD